MTSFDTHDEPDLARLDQILDAAGSVPTISGAARAALLNAVANNLEADARHLIDLADQETCLGRTVLAAELDRATYQLRSVAAQVADGSYLGIRVDEADASPAPVGHPDVRRTAAPVGPVAVFAASNFPFAFGVVGGDTAGALGVGCAVVAKAHPEHARLDNRLADHVRRAMDTPARFALVSGFAVGRALVAHPGLRAVAFTGSTMGGRALYDIAVSRPNPIPFYGELGAVNPVFVTPAGAREPERLAREWVDSLLVRFGQMCTNPGLLIVPSGSGIPSLASALLGNVPASTMLGEGIAAAYFDNTKRVAAIPGAAVHLHATRPAPASSTPALVSFRAEDALEELEAVQTECFGPAGIVIEYDAAEQALHLAAGIHGTLVGTVHGDPDEPLAGQLLALLSRSAGRLVWNGWPTGVAVTAAQHHGGPYPATTDARSTSVGELAVARFLRPVAFQGLPATLLPAELRRTPLVS